MNKNDDDEQTKESVDKVTVKTACVFKKHQVWIFKPGKVVVNSSGTLLALGLVCYGYTLRNKNTRDKILHILPNLGLLSGTRCNQFVNSVSGVLIDCLIQSFVNHFKQFTSLFNLNICYVGWMEWWHSIIFDTIR